jgi:isopropylmalate/homocitrate/citramalate synthase
VTRCWVHLDSRRERILACIYMGRQEEVSTSFSLEHFQKSDPEDLIVIVHAVVISGPDRYPYQPYAAEFGR